MKHVPRDEMLKCIQTAEEMIAEAESGYLSGSTVSVSLIMYSKLRQMVYDVLKQFEEDDETQVRRR